MSTIYVEREEFKLNIIEAIPQFGEHDFAVFIDIDGDLYFTPKVNQDSDWVVFLDLESLDSFVDPSINPEDSKLDDNELADYIIDNGIYEIFVEFICENGEKNKYFVEVTK